MFRKTYPNLVFREETFCPWYILTLSSCCNEQTKPDFCSGKTTRVSELNESIKAHWPKAKRKNPIKIYCMLWVDWSFQWYEINAGIERGPINQNTSFPTLATSNEIPFHYQKQLNLESMKCFILYWLWFWKAVFFNQN
jgi:hypothetical protein